MNRVTSIHPASGRWPAGFRQLFDRSSASARWLKRKFTKFASSRARGHDVRCNGAWESS